MPVIDFFDCLVNARTKIVLFASSDLVENIMEFAPSLLAPHTRMAIIYRKGENFRTFFTELFTMMVKQRMRVTTALVRLAPQNSNNPHEGNPETLLTV